MAEVPCPNCGVGNPEHRTKCYRCEGMFDGSVPVPSDSKAARGAVGAAKEWSRVGDLLWEYAIDEHRITDRWSTKAQADEITGFTRRLNRRGAEGWEMIGYEAVPIVGGFTSTIKGYGYLVFWKRPVS